jgi:hypothetical protein
LAAAISSNRFSKFNSSSVYNKLFVCRLLSVLSLKIVESDSLVVSVVSEGGIEVVSEIWYN